MIKPRYSHTKYKEKITENKYKTAQQTWKREEIVGSEKLILLKHGAQPGIAHSHNTNKTKDKQEP